MAQSTAQEYLWEEKKMGRMWVTGPPSVYDLAVSLDVPVHECSGSLYFGGDMPPVCRSQHMQRGNGTFNADLGLYLYAFRFSDDGIALVSIVPQSRTAQFVEHGLECTFSPLLYPNITELFSCKTPTIFAATYYPDGTSDMWLVASPRHSIQNGFMSIIALFCIGYLLGYGKRLTRHEINNVLTRRQRSVLSDVLATVCTTAMFDLFLMKGASFHPSMSVIADEATLDMLAMLFAATIGTNISVAFAVATPMKWFDKLIPMRITNSRILQLLCRAGYELALLQSLVILTPTLIAPYYHTMLQFSVGVATIVICSRDMSDITYCVQDCPAATAVAGIVLMANVVVGAVCMLPNLLMCEAVAPWVEISLMVSLCAQSLVVGYREFWQHRITR